MRPLPILLIAVGITPGNNLGFEAAPFKMTQEMLDVMGGGVESEHFAAFQELTARAFLIARENSGAIHALVAGMADSGLPCFFFPETLQKVSEG